MRESVKSPAVCDLSRYQGVLWSLPVEVGGRTRRFLLDLGAGVTSLDGRVADELGLHEIRRVTGTRMTGERLELPLIEPTDLRIAGTAFRPRSLGRLDFSTLLPPDWPPVDGVLALDLFEDHPFTVDFAEGRLHLLGTGDTSGLVPVPARLVRQIPSVSLGVSLAVSCPDGELWFELDNSNTGPVLLSPGAASRLGIAPAAGQDSAEIRVPGLDPVRTPVLVRDLVYDGNLGRSFVEGRRFAFDLSTGRVWVGPRGP